jgi:hypothetical protein
MGKMNKLSKKINMIFAGIITLSFISLCASALIGTAAQLSFTMISQSPDPVDPGSIVELRWMIENNGGGAAEDVQVEIVPEYPFSLYSGELIKNIGTIQGQQTGDKAVIILYKVEVDGNAVEGTNEIKLRYRTASTGWVELDPFDINIQTVDATLSLEKIKVDPEVAAPGENLKATLTIRNLADSFLKDISVKLDLSSTTLPFAPIQSATEKRVRQLDSGASAELSYDMIVEPDADPGVYKIPVTITFNDNLGNSYERDDLFGVIVGTTPDISYYIDSTTVSTAGSKGSVSIKFVNKGLGNIKFLNVVMKESSSYSIISPKEVYIGNIDSDDYETADFQLFVNPKAPKELELQLEVAYKDANNRDYTENTSVILNLYKKSEAVSLGIQEKNNTTGIIISILVVVIGVVAYIMVRRARKKK